MGIGIAGGSMLGASGGALAHLKRGYLAGLLLCALALVATAAAPSFAIALPLFALVGIGNGVALVYERLLLQTTIADDMVGRVFGVKNALVSWSFAIAFLSAGAVASLLGPRPVFALAGAGALVAWMLASVALRQTWTEEPSVAAPAEAQLPQLVPAQAEAELSRFMRVEATA
jgi:MFS family permease